MSERTTADEAASWFLRLEETAANAETFLEWQRWLTASPEHRVAFDQIEETLLRLARANAQPALPSAAEMAADTYDGSVAVADYVSSPPACERRPTPRMTRKLRYAIAAGLLILSLSGGWWWFATIRAAQHGTFAYSTAPGERLTVTLPEGSKITLDADSALNIELTPQQRSLQLARGEAYFRVARDRARPFVVSAGGTHVRAIGTAFNVRMSDHRTVIAVVEGKVEVGAVSKTPQDPQRLPARDPIDSERAASRPPDEKSSSPVLPRVITLIAAGQAVAYTEDERLQALPAAEASIATTWLGGRRQYLNEPLQYVLADMNRYTRRQIEVADAATGELQFTGTLDLKKSDAWLKGLAIALPVTITQKSDGVLLVTLSKM